MFTICSPYVHLSALGFSLAKIGLAWTQVVIIRGTVEKLVGDAPQDWNAVTCRQLWASLQLISTDFNMFLAGWALHRANTEAWRLRGFAALPSLILWLQWLQFPSSLLLWNPWTWLRPFPNSFVTCSSPFFPHPNWFPTYSNPFFPTYSNPSWFGFPYSAIFSTYSQPFSIHFPIFPAESRASRSFWVWARSNAPARCGLAPRAPGCASCSVRPWLNCPNPRGKLGTSGNHWEIIGNHGKYDHYHSLSCIIHIVFWMFGDMSWNIFWDLICWDVWAEGKAERIELEGFYE